MLAHEANLEKACLINGTVLSTVCICSGNTSLNLTSSITSSSLIIGVSDESLSNRL